MSATARVFERDGHTYELFEINGDLVWNLFEDFGMESALVGSISQSGAQFSIECYWKPQPDARSHNVEARTVGEAVHALLDLASGEDPRSSTVGADGDQPGGEAMDPSGFQIHTSPADSSGRFSE